MAVAALLVAAVPRAGAAQGSTLERMADRLQLTSLGAGAGPAWIARVEPTQAYAIQADYGEIAPRWHIVLNVTYWGSRFDAEETARLEELVRRLTIDPSGDDTVRIGTVRISDVAFEAEARWMVLRGTALRPFLGAGLGAHVLNAENRYIADTFVEHALDMIGTGVTVVGGADIAPVRWLAVGVQARYTLISNTRFFTLRAGGSYIFPPTRRSQ